MRGAQAVRIFRRFVEGQFKALTAARVGTTQTICKDAWPQCADSSGTVRQPPGLHNQILSATVREFHAAGTALQLAELADQDELRREREEVRPPRIRPSLAEDPFLLLPEVQGATEGPLFEYRKNRASGLYKKDPRQEATSLALQHLYSDLKVAVAGRQNRRSGLTVVDHLHVSDAPPEGSWWSWLRLPGNSQAEAEQPKVKGLYMYGGVGTGKTMLMDVFVHCCTEDFKVRRVHFHDFMLDVHAHLKAYSHTSDPLSHVGGYIADNWRVLALDEFFVTDVADASILNRLFTRLWSLGLVVVATSNRAPDALYEGGLQRELFLPFIARLKENCVVHNMESGIDYRRLAHHHRGLYFMRPDFDDPASELEERFQEVVRAGNQPEHAERVIVQMGRHIDVQRAGATVCKITFDDLCGRPVAAADYIALANRFHTMALSGIPIFGGANRNAAYRFVTLVDVLYEHRIRLFCSAAGSPFDLFQHIVTMAEARDPTRSKEEQRNEEVDDNLAFAKERCISRLLEMQSLEYLISHAELHAPMLLMALRDLQKKQARGVSRKF